MFFGVCGLLWFGVCAGPCCRRVGHRPHIRARGSSEKVNIRGTNNKKEPHPPNATRIRCPEGPYTSSHSRGPPIHRRHPMYPRPSPRQALHLRSRQLRVSHCSSRLGSSKTLLDFVQCCHVSVSCCSCREVCFAGTPAVPANLAAKRHADQGAQGALAS